MLGFRLTVTIWHNVAFDAQGRHTAMLEGYQPGDPVVRVFAYQASPGRAAGEIAEEAFAIFNDHPRDPDGANLACAYYGRRLRSLSFPGKEAPAAGESRTRRPFRAASQLYQPGTGEAGQVRDSHRGERTWISSVALAAAPGSAPAPAGSRTAAWRR